MSNDTSSGLNIELVKKLRSRAIEMEKPSDLLIYLTHQVDSEDLFIQYLTTALMDNSVAYTVALRWWRGDMSQRGADLALGSIIERNKSLW